MFSFKMVSIKVFYNEDILKIKPSLVALRQEDEFCYSVINDISDGRDFSAMTDE